MAEISIEFCEEQIDKDTDLFFIPDGMAGFSWNLRSNKETIEKLSKFTKISIPESFNTSRSFFMDYFTNLKEGEIRGNATELKSFFAGCKKLEKLTVPSSITVIKQEALKDCVSLKEINLPQKLEKIEASAFENCTSLSYSPTLTGSVFNYGGLPIPNFQSDFTIPAQFTEIGARAFSNCKELKKITIPTTVSFIESYAFKDCIGLENVVFEEGFNIIPKSTFSSSKEWFSGCTALKSIEFPKSLKTIPIGTFANCTSLENVVIPDNIEEIGHEAFSNCTALKSITISDSITELTAKLFLNCKSLENIKLPKNLKVIRDSVFEGCENLKQIELPQTLEKIKNKAFVDCKSLTKIVIPSSVNEFIYTGTDSYYRNNAIMFTGCDSLKEVELNFTQDEIGPYTFRKIINLEYNQKRQLEKQGLSAEEIKKLDNIEKTCPALEVVKLPVVKTINACLKNITSLKKIIFPDELGSLEPEDIVTLSSDVELEASENAKIGINLIEKEDENGNKKVVAKEVFVKKTGRLLGVITKENAFNVSSNIKQVNADCFPDCIIDLTLPPTIKKIKIDDSYIHSCSNNVLKYLQEFKIDESAKLEKAKKEKIAQIKATSAGGLVLAKLEDYKYGIENSPVTKPRVGTNVKVNLPFGFGFEYFSPSKPKPTEKEPLDKLVNAILTPIDESKGIDGEIDFVETMKKALEEFKASGFTYNKINGTFTEEIIDCFLKRKINEKNFSYYLDRSARNLDIFFKLSEKRVVGKKSISEFSFFWFENVFDYINNLFAKKNSPREGLREKDLEIIDLDSFVMAEN